MMLRQLNKTLLLLSILPLVVFGQTNYFSFTQHDTAYVGSEEFIVLYGDIISLHTENQDLTVSRVTHEMPTTWSCSFCVGDACLPPFLDTYDFTLEVGDTSEFSLDTSPNGEQGFGSWTMYATNTATEEVDSVHITLEYVVVGVDPEPLQPWQYALSAIYPNPTNASINFDLQVAREGNFTVELYALDGRQISSRNYTLRSGTNKLQWNVNGLSSGSYLLVARNGGQTLTQKVSVIK